MGHGWNNRYKYKKRAMLIQVQIGPVTACELVDAVILVLTSSGEFWQVLWGTVWSVSALINEWHWWRRRGKGRPISAFHCKKTVHHLLPSMLHHCHFLQRYLWSYCEVLLKQPTKFWEAEYFPCLTFCSDTKKKKLKRGYTATWLANSY